MFKIKPRLFISYTREDIQFARSLYYALLEAGYNVFFDETSIFVGDVFPEKIVRELKKSDGCVILISASSVNSEWCKLEAYYAHFFKKIFIPIKIGNGNYDAESPLRSIQKDIQYVTVVDPSQTNSIVQLISNKLLHVKKNARGRILKSAGIFLSISLLIVLIFTFGVNRINSLLYNKEKSSLLESIGQSNKIYNNQEIDLVKQKFNNDQELVAQLHLQASDPGLNENARINSRIVSSTLLQSFSFARRQYFENVKWLNSSFHNGVFNNASFISGQISQVDFYNSRFNDVYFNGTDSGQKGMALSGLTFSNCSFNAVSFDRNNAVDLNFKACRFNGTFLNTTAFGAVNFFSDSAENPAVITTDVLASFENCIIQNDNGPDPPNTIVLGKEEEMQFKEVLFDGCRFVGLVRPEWFKNCTFLNCYFPSESIISQLKNGNIMNNSRIN